MRSPRLPVFKPKAATVPESAVLKAVLEYLTAKHILAFRTNTGAMKAEYNGKARFIKFGTPGMADVLAFPPGIWRKVSQPPILWIECKSSVGKQSDLQKSFQAQVEAEGHRYIVARSIEDVTAALR